jgi:7,8-dihydropterin-6-yl-methyl-4-(beta-D-ribofuranosyl)aminobenzene 5'-phosphate synthase
MGKRILLGIAILSWVVSFGCQGKEAKGLKVSGQEGVKPSTDATIVVVYDNNPYDKRLKTAWGFSCLVKFEGKVILFDTGGDAQALLYNMEKLIIDLSEIDAVVLSHIHGDHVGGLSGFLKQHSDVTVFVPRSFPLSFKDEAKSYGAKVEEIDSAKELFDNIYTTGQLGRFIKEQSLILNTKEGLVVITGCAHPGVVKIVERSKQLVGGKVFLVMGGFHLLGTSDRDLRQIIADFKELGVVKVGPCHCSGDRAKELFRQAFGENFLDVGVGREVVINADL